MRHFTRARLLLVVLVALLALPVSTASAAAPTVVNGTFDDGFTGWDVAGTPYIDSNGVAIVNMDNWILQRIYVDVGACEVLTVAFDAVDIGSGASVSTRYRVEDGSGYQISIDPCPGTCPQAVGAVVGATASYMDIRLTTTSVAYAGIDNVTASCTFGTPSEPADPYGGEPYTDHLSDGTTMMVYPSATFGDVALFIAVASLAAMQIIAITLVLLIRNRIIKWMN